MKQKRQKQNNLGGFCMQCGGTGRSETGCQSCQFCNRDPLKEMKKSPLGKLLLKLSTQMAISRMDNPDGLHTHVCTKCRFKWQHKNSCINDTEAHTCRECGCEQWETDRRDSGGVLMQCARVI